MTLLAPVPRPRAIFGIGRNYAAHAAELGNELPEQPIVFMKLPTSSVPPAGPVRCPAVVEQLDYEGELAVVMGAEGGRSPAGRSPTTSAPATSSDASRSGRAPRASTPRARGGRGSRRSTRCRTRSGLRIGTWVNGELRQDATTSDLIFGPQELVDFIAETCTLEPGDLILTGTPDGVGMAFDPPRFLQSGDVVRIEIERLGAIEHARRLTPLDSCARPGRALDGSRARRRAVLGVGPAGA